MTAIVQQYIQYIAWPDSRAQAVKIAERKFSNVVMPDKYTYAFYFFELVEETVEIRGESVKLTSARRDESPIYYYDAKVYTKEEFAKEKPVEKWERVLERAREYESDKLLLLRTGEVFAYEDGMIIVTGPK